MARSACEVRGGAVTLRFEAGLPAHGRTVDGRAAAKMLLDFVPECVERTLFVDDGLLDQAWAAVELADDQRAAREQMEASDLVAFVANGSILPRESGVSRGRLKARLPSRPLRSSALCWICRTAARSPAWASSAA